MAKIKPERAYAKEIFDGFSGIGANMAVGGKQASDIRNFRILSDGSLQKRCGWENLRSFSALVRAYWEGSVNQVNYTFAVAGNQIYRLTGNSSTKVGTLSDSLGRLRFFAFGDTLFLLTGRSILSYSPASNSFVEADGYVPLIGYNWHPTDLGEIHEPMNLLSKRVRVHYFNTIGTDTFHLPFYAQNVDRVRVNGTLTTNYSLDSTMMYLTVPSAASASSVEVAFTLKTADDLRARIITCKNPFLAQREDSTILALYGSTNQNLLFCASPVSEQMLNAARAVYSTADALYFPQSGLLTLGDTAHPLTSLYYHMGRILAFHSEGAFSVYFAKDGNGVEFYPILKGMGCNAIDAQLYLDGDPIVINAGGIFRLHATVSEPDTFEISCISDMMPHLSGENFANNAVVFENPMQRELWFSSSPISSGRVWVYQIEQKQWVSFDNIAPSFFFFGACSIGFATGAYLRVFDEVLDTDNDLPIVARYTTSYLPFSYPENAKRALRLTVCSHGTRNALEITVRTENKTRMFSLSQNASSAPVLYDTRVPLGRFKLAQVELCDRNVSRTRIFRLALFANL